MANKPHWHDCTDTYIDPKKVKCEKAGKDVYMLTESLNHLPKGFMFRDINTLEHYNA